MIIKEFLQLRRDRRMLPLIFVAPIFQILILGYAATTDVKNISLVVCNYDRSAESRDYISHFEPSGYFTIEEYAQSQQEVIEYLDKSRAMVGIVIPHHFGRDLQKGTPVKVQVLADGADANTANIGTSYIAQITAGYSQRILVERISRLLGTGTVPGIKTVTRVWFNPELRSANFMIPGVIALILMIVTATLTAVSIVREREIGTMEQLLVTPLKPIELLLGKIIPFTIIGFFDVVLVLAVGILWFDLPMKGSIPLLFGLSALFVMTTLGIGLFVSTISNTQQQAMLIAQFFVFFPFMMLSGFTFPIENMPVLFQYITLGIPLRYFLVILRDLFLKGSGMDILWPQTLALAGFGIVILALSVLRFRKRLG
jgi:ABC-2 type transport system permease protein